MTNDVEELKQFAGLHAKAQGLSRVGELLGRVRTDEGAGPGSWVGEWSRAGDALRDRGRFLEAARHYNLARFPYVDGDARCGALENCVDAFEHWAANQDIHRLDLPLPDGVVRCWTTGLSATRRLPVLLMCGGIVSIKEQWATALTGIARLGFAGVVFEMPGVGENTLPYDARSPSLLSAILDAIADRADVSAAYALMFSFSGHLALSRAIDDPRIRGIVTAGAPVHDFFADADRMTSLPRVTVDTLAHLTGTDAHELPDLLKPWALSAGQLAALKIPVGYAASSRDEIIPASDPAFLRAHAPAVELVEHDDVHGSPRYVAQTRLWTIATIARMRGGRPVRTAVLGAVSRLAGLVAPAHR